MWLSSGTFMASGTPIYERNPCDGVVTMKDNDFSKRFFLSLTTFVHVTQEAIFSMPEYRL